MSSPISLLLVFTTLLALAKSAEKIDCYQEGECLHSFFLDIGVAETAKDCHDFCLGIPECEFFTLYLLESGNECMAFGNCVEYSTDTCDNCISGERACTEIDCFFQGMCQGDFVARTHAENPNECLELCRGEDGCEWFVFDEEDYFCIMTSSCDQVDAACASCTSGHAGCARQQEHTKLFVAGGNVGPEHDHISEMVDLSSINTRCSNPARFPGRGGAALLRSFNQPMLCGGYREGNWTNECYRYNQDTDVWIRYFRSLLEIRYLALSVKIGYGQYWILGGRDEHDTPKSTSEIYTENVQFAQGPTLPEPMSAGCALRLNSTHTFVVTGLTHDAVANVTSPSAHAYLVESMTWTRLPDISTARYDPACGFYKTTNGNINVVVAAGSGLTVVDILNLRTLQWRTGPAFPYPMQGGYPVQFEDHFLVTGGYNGTYLSTIYRFDEDEDWKLLVQSLEVPRDIHVAFAVPDTYANCDVVEL